MDKDKISISGFSSGAYFSVQFHVSFSETIMGAGIVAGGTYRISGPSYHATTLLI